jgi:hypothetical protein
MKPPKPLFIAFFLLTFLVIPSHSQCKKFDAEANVSHTTDGNNNGSIELKIEGISTRELTVNLFGPKRQNRLGLSEFLINDLERGHYLVVISARDEDASICPVSINVNIN